MFKLQALLGVSLVSHVAMAAPGNWSERRTHAPPPCCLTEFPLAILVLRAAQPFCSTYLGIAPYAATTTKTSTFVTSRTLATTTHTQTITSSPTTTTTTTATIVSDPGTTFTTSTETDTSDPGTTTTSTTSFETDTTTIDIATVTSTVETDTVPGTTTFTTTVATSYAHGSNGAPAPARKRTLPVVPIPAWLPYKASAISSACSCLVTPKTKTVSTTTSTTVRLTATSSKTTTTTLALVTSVINTATTTTLALVTSVELTTTTTTLPLVTSAVTTATTTLTTVFDTETDPATATTTTYTTATAMATAILCQDPSTYTTHQIFSAQPNEFLTGITTQPSPDACCSHCFATVGCSAWSFNGALTSTSASCFVFNADAGNGTTTTECPTGYQHYAHSAFASNNNVNGLGPCDLGA